MSEVPPEGEVDASGGLLRMAGHGFDKHLQRALQQHVDAAVVVIVVTVRAKGKGTLATQQGLKQRATVFKGVISGACGTDRIPYRQWM